MADSSPPRIVRSLTGGAGGKVFHAKKFNGENAPGGGGGGLESGFRGGGGRGLTNFGSAAGGAGDPAVTGNFQYNPTTTFLHFPIAGGGLTAKGQRDQADNDILNKGTQAYAEARSAGANDQEAFTAAVRAGGGVPLLVAMLNHQSSPLASLPAAHAFLSGGTGQPSGPAYGAVDKSGQQISYDPNTGQAIGASRVPGYDTGQPAFDTKRMVKTDKGLGYIQDDGSVKPMSWSNGNPIPNGGGVITSAGGSGPNGQVGLPPTAAQTKADAAAAAAANRPLTTYSKDPIPTADAKHPLTNAQVSYLSNAPNFINDLKVARDYADTSGPISGSVNYVGGKYLGLNAEGAVAAAALNRLDQGVYNQWGVKGSAGAKQLMATLPTHNQAPSYVRTAITGMIENATTELQNQADLIEKQSGPLPGTLKTQLEGKVDVYPLSSQNNASPSWVARNYPDQLTGPMATSLAHRTDLEPSEVQGLNTKLDTVAARRTQDAQTAAQTSAAQDAAVKNRPSSLPPTTTAPAGAQTTSAGATTSEGTSGAGQPPTGSSATTGAPQGSQAPPQPTTSQGQGQAPVTTLPDVNVTGSGEVVPGVTVAPNSPFATPPAAMPNSSATPMATPAPPAAPPASSPVAPQTEATPPAQPAVNPYAAAAIDALGQGT